VPPRSHQPVAEGSEERERAVAVRGIWKSFGGVEALRGVDLLIQPGEVHALLGPNGAGKSTLIKCLGGAVTPDQGEIVLGERIYHELAPTESREAGVSVIYQSFSLIPTLSVAENIFLGEERRFGPFVRRRQQEREARELLEMFHQDLDPTARVSDLPIASQQLIEIAKAMRRNPKLLILDEPTASLTDVEAKLLAEQLRRLKSRGMPILYVTHLLQEVFDVADRVTVLRDGAVVLSARVSEVTHDDLVSAITGETLGDLHRPTSSAVQAGVSPLLELRKLRALGIGPLDLTVRPGEVVAVFGLLGSGRTELVETIFGVRQREAGEVFLDGRSVSFDGPHGAIAEGVALVPGERLRLSLFLSLPNLDNVLMPTFTNLARCGLRSSKEEKRRFGQVASVLQLRPPDPRLRSRQLSGGNQQKVAVGRWLGAEGSVRLLMLDEPTQGIDIGTRTDLYRILRGFVAADNRGVLLTSSDPEETIAVADRVYVLYRGRVVDVLEGPDVDEHSLLSLAQGKARTPA
jgi:ABC-type sugar transport system ATPase subunit